MIQGLIVLNKPGNITSHDAVDKIRTIFNMKKVGHFGTLDPLAEGILLIALGKATKFFDFYVKKRKLYSGVIKFGYSTATYDSEGAPVSEKKEIDLRKTDIKEILSGFTGKIAQVPPIYSAKKVKGKPLYKYARENIEVKIKPVNIEIFSLQGKVLGKDTLWFEALTSSGTYIRSLAHDIGQKTGVGAFLESLKRVKIGEFDIRDSVTLDRLTEEVKSGNITKVVTPIESLLPEFPKIIVNQGGRKAVLNGMPLEVKDIIKVLSTEKSEYFRLFDEEGKLLSISRKDAKLMRFNSFIVFSD
ncbi:MAG: tRNA pseudouridine(55) synthase TruB, partial [Candidatus Aminicenantes bacterium]|nr:tRNA pseudouridine(55) synthase TruB [Candidatus Aminicenantes bacterium]